MTEKQIAKLSHDEAIEELATAKTSVTEKRDEFYAFLKENKLKRNKDYSEDAKHGKKFSKFKTEIDKLVILRDGIKEQAKATKPKKAGGRASTYEYPADVTTPEEKKKYRTKMRAEAKKAEKAKEKAEAPEVPADEKAAKKTAKKKPAKKASKKKEAVVEDED